MDMAAPEMKEILEASAVLRADKDRGRALLLELWEKHSAEGSPLQLSSIAHILADTETEVASELEWDLRALEAATGSREAEDLEPLPPLTEVFLPSLHLSVATGYLRIGDRARARSHVLIAERHIGALADDAYGDLVRGGLKRLQAALAPAGQT